MKQKKAFEGLSSNITKQSVKRISKCIKGISNVTRSFDQASNVPTSFGYHIRKPKTKDVMTMMEQLWKTEVFRFHIGRNHKYFKSL